MAHSNYRISLLVRGMYALQFNQHEHFTEAIDQWQASKLSDKIHLVIGCEREQLNAAIISLSFVCAMMPKSNYKTDLTRLKCRKSLGSSFRINTYPPTFNVIAGIHAKSALTFFTRWQTILRGNVWFDIHIPEWIPVLRLAGWDLMSMSSSVVRNCVCCVCWGVVVTNFSTNTIQVYNIVK